MKKYWIKLADCAATAVVILLIVLGMVDLHTDGLLVRDGCYVIRPNDMQTYRMDIYGGSGVVGTQVQLTRDVDWANQVFGVRYTGEDQYMIEYGDQGYCIAVASDKETVVMQDYNAENEYNKWYITRIGTTQSYLFTNVATGNALCYDYDTVAGVYRLYVKEYDETDGRFSFTLAR